MGKMPETCWDSVNNQHPQLTINHLYCCILLVFFLHALLTMHGHRNIKRVFWFSLQLLSETFLVLRRTERDKTKTYFCLHVKHCLFLSDFNDTWIFLTDFRQIPKCQISWKSVQWVPSCSMRTDIHRHNEVNSRFSQFCQRAQERRFETPSSF